MCIQLNNVPGWYPVDEDEIMIKTNLQSGTCMDKYWHLFFVCFNCVIIFYFSEEQNLFDNKTNGVKVFHHVTTL